MQNSKLKQLSSVRIESTIIDCFIHDTINPTKYGAYRANRKSRFRFPHSIDKIHPRIHHHHPHRHRCLAKKPASCVYLNPPARSASQSRSKAKKSKIQNPKARRTSKLTPSHTPSDSPHFPNPPSRPSTHDACRHTSPPHSHCSSLPKLGDKSAPTRACRPRGRRGR